MRELFMRELKEMGEKYSAAEQALYSLQKSELCFLVLLLYMVASSYIEPHLSVHLLTRANVI